jgi:hypothetical protein
VVDFGTRRKLLAVRLLARKKHQLVRQSLYVPLPVFVAVSSGRDISSSGSQPTKGSLMPKDTEYTECNRTIFGSVRPSGAYNKNIVGIGDGPYYQ